MSSPWIDPTLNGEDIVYWVLAKEGKAVDDPFALQLARQAITDAHLWIWRQHDWFWSRKQGWFDAYRISTLVGSSNATDTTIYPADPDQFSAGDLVMITDSGSDKELVTVASKTHDAVTLSSALVNGIDNSDATPPTARVLGELVQGTAGAYIDAQATAGAQVLPVSLTGNFTAGDLIVINPDKTTAEYHRISAITTNVALQTSTNLINTHAAGGRVFKVTENKRSYPLRAVNGGMMQDLGRVLSVRVDTDGELMPMTRSEFQRSYEDDLSGGLSAGDRYLIEGDPPVLKLERSPSGSQVIYVDYLALPSKYTGSGHISLPIPFQDLLRYVARWYFRLGSDDQQVPLEQDPIAQSWLARLKTHGYNEEPGGVMRAPGGREVLAGLLPLRYNDYLSSDGSVINP